MWTRYMFVMGAATAIAAAQGMGPMGGGMHRMMGSLPARMDAAGQTPTEAQIRLGRMLFYDPRLSAAGDVSCNSCHDLTKYGVDGKPVSTGHKGQVGSRNSPSVYHAAGHVAQFWDGRAKDVEEQAKGPVLNPVEMAMGSETEVVTRLKAIPGYVAAFQKAYPDQYGAVSFDLMAKSIGAFERGLVTPSRWDRFMKGDRSAITREEMQGHHEFMHNGCASCHNGPYVGGSRMERLGVGKPWPKETDVGKMAITGMPEDKMVFKVPSLRNVAVTGPWFHDGQVAKLEQAIQLMGRHQLDMELSKKQISNIASWLRTLTGEIPSDYIQKPELPQGS